MAENVDQAELVESVQSLSIHSEPVKGDAKGDTELDAGNNTQDELKAGATTSEAEHEETEDGEESGVTKSDDETITTSTNENEAVEEHMELTIPTKECASMIYAEKYSAKKMMHLTGAKVKIRFHDDGVLLKARGDATSLQKVRESLVDIAKTSSYMITNPSLGRMLVVSANAVLFEHNTSLGDTMTFLPYEGPIQPQDDGMRAFLPTLDARPKQAEDLAFQKYMDTFCRQMQLIRDDYVPTTHGILRMAVSFGTIYMIHVEPSIRHLLVAEFEELQLMRYGKTNVQRGAYRGRGRGYNFRQGTRNTHLLQLPRNTFYPHGAKDIEQTTSKIRDLGFCLVKSSQYNSMGIEINTDSRKPCECTLVLDEDFHFIELRLPDIRWMTVDVKRMSIEGSRCEMPDMRVKMTSSRLLHPEEIAEPKYERDLGAFITRTTNPLFKTEQGKLAVNRQFILKRSVVRQKQDDVYEYRGSSENTFLNTIQFNVMHVKEFSRPDLHTGEFGHVVENRPEIAIRSKLDQLPNLQDESCYKSFATDLWNFAMSFRESI